MMVLLFQSLYSYYFFHFVGLCSINNGGCEHYCVDTVNSSYCECAPGYTLESDQHNCSCEFLHYHNYYHCLQFLVTPSCSISNGGCEQICTQLEGSVSCSCNSGFSVNNTFYCSGKWLLLLHTYCNIFRQ